MLSKTEKVLRAIAKKPLTNVQIRTRFNVSNPTAVIYNIRLRGYNVDVSIGKDGLKLYSL